MYVFPGIFINYIYWCNRAYRLVLSIIYFWYFLLSITILFVNVENIAAHLPTVLCLLSAIYCAICCLLTIVYYRSFMHQCLLQLFGHAEPCCTKGRCTDHPHLGKTLCTILTTSKRSMKHFQCFFSSHVLSSSQALWMNVI